MGEHHTARLVFRGGNTRSSRVSVSVWAGWSMYSVGSLQGCGSFMLRMKIIFSSKMPLICMVNIKPLCQVTCVH